MVPSRREVDRRDTARLQRQPGTRPSTPTAPPPGNDAFTSFVHGLCLEARINLLVQPLVDPKLLHPAVFGAELRRAHRGLRDAARHDAQMRPALRVLDEIIELNGATIDFRHALHLV